MFPHIIAAPLYDLWCFLLLPTEYKSERKKDLNIQARVTSLGKVSILTHPVGRAGHEYKKSPFFRHTGRSMERKLCSGFPRFDSLVLN